MRKRSVVISVLVVLGIAGAALAWASSRFYTVPIIMYHQVYDAGHRRLDTVSPERFEWHMAYLKKHRFHVLPLSALVRIVKEGEPLPRKIVVISFDDGYENNYRYAFPILKKYQFPATIFMISDFVNVQGYLTTAQLKEMLAHGIEIGSHTRRHVYLPDVSPEERVQEIKGSKARLEEELGVPVGMFSYPTGGFSEEIKQQVREAGYEGACTTNRGYDRLMRDPYEFKRIRFSDADNRIDYLWMKLSGFYNLFREAKNPY